jgi:O-antigen/teichoic acid export membrane protein
VTTIAFAVGVLWYAGRHLAPPARPTLRVIRQVLGFSLRGYVGTIAHQGFLRIDALFVSARLGPTSVGLYAQASGLAERMSTLGHAVYSSSAVRLGSDLPERAAALVAEIIRVLLLVMVPVALVLAVLSRSIMVVLFGSDFAPAAKPFAILLPGTVCLTLWYVLSLYLTSTLRRPGTATIIQGLGFLASVPAYWLAVEQWGINGAAAVSTVTYVAVFAAGLVMLFRTSGVRRSDLLPRASDIRHMMDLARRAIAARPRRPARSH